VDQDFALVIQGEIPFPGTGLVVLDKAAYTAPSSIQVKVYDSDLTNQTTTTVLVKSSTEVNGEILLLRATSIPGSFTGAIATVTGPPAADSRLQISHNDTITAVYQDAGIPRTATARADLVPPVITSVTSTNEFGMTVVSWNTDEPADGIVRFNTNSASLTRSATNFTLTTHHSVQLTNVVAGKTYFFTVVSRDEAGNVASNNNGGLLFQFTAVSPATVLLVNAYHLGGEPDVTPIPVSSYTNALAQTGVSYDLWDTTQRGGSPNLANLRSYRIVMWRINDAYDSSDTLSTSEQSTIQQYVNGGGAFFMASMEILTRLGPVAFRTNLLHVARFIPNPDPFFGECADCDEDHKVPEIEGVPQDPITDNVLVNLDYSSYPDDIFGLGLGPDFSDTFGPTTNAAPILLDYASGRPCGMRFPRTGVDSTGRVAFLSFPLDTIPNNTAAPGNRVSLLRKTLQFLAPGLGGFGSVTLDRSVYTVPDFVTVELADSDLAGQGTATATYYSSADATRRTLTVNETPLPGLFRGFLRLIPASSNPGPGEVRAADGGTVTLEYLDASAHQTVGATANIDTHAPEISGVHADPLYEEATITWDTTEESDSQVIYGESPLLGRSAFVDELDTSHEVLLPGLRPNRLYFYKVVSRDAAGNVVEDDNGGDLYSFTTLPPLPTPYNDNMENLGTNWSVFNGEDSGVSWELGEPDNIFYGPSAHSPTQAWGSNLKGQFIDTADTFLISPAIDLTGGNKANLHFWHNYDFSDVTEGDIIEAGYIYVVTNTLADPVLVATFEDATVDWEEVNVDLTPFLGHVIYLVWHYQMLSFDSFPRLGWLIDDVSITASNIPPGTIVISNALAQGPYVMTGPMNRNGRGSVLLTNALPGTYTVTFGAVPYYYTPPAQTNTLVASSNVVFRGNYTFDDANNNGISDAWELHYFGTVSPSRTRFTDTDGDGASDYAEFIAGTSPTSSTSTLRVAQPVRLPDGTYRIDWQSISGKIYRVEGSADAVHWTGVSEWIQATSSILTFNIPPPAPGGPYLFRLQVQP
jgi:hypothetical protein